MNSLFKHQINGIEIAASHPRFLFAWEPGLGKSRIMVETIKESGVRALITAPLAVVDLVWIKEEFRKWAPDLEVINLWEYDKEDRNAASRRGDVVVSNYETLRISEKDIDYSGFGIFVCDESSKLKGRTTAIAKTVTRFGRKIPRCYLLSGTPAPNNELEYFPQVDLVAPGLLGSSYWAFRVTYFYPALKDPKSHMVWKWAMRPEMREQFIRKLATVSQFLSKKDCLDLPEKTFMRRQVFLSAPEWAAYEKLRRDLVIQFTDATILAGNTLVLLMKLRQLTSGFSHVLEERPPVRFGNSKGKAVVELLEEIGRDKQVVLWINFREEARHILEAISTLGPAARFDGETPTTDRAGILSKWRSGEIRYLVCHPAAAGHGLTLTEASHAIYVSLSHSLELFLQSQDRIHRISQNNPCTYHILEAVGPKGQKTIDMDIWRALQSKDLTAARILEGLKR